MRGLLAFKGTILLLIYGTEGVGSRRHEVNFFGLMRNGEVKRGEGVIFLLFFVQQGIFLVRCIIKAMKPNDKWLMACI